MSSLLENNPQFHSLGEHFKEMLLSIQDEVTADDVGQFLSVVVQARVWEMMQADEPPREILRMIRGLAKKQSSKTKSAIAAAQASGVFDPSMHALGGGDDDPPPPPLDDDDDDAEFDLEAAGLTTEMSDDMPSPETMLHVLRARVDLASDAAAIINAVDAPAPAPAEDEAQPSLADTQPSPSPPPPKVDPFAELQEHEETHRFALEGQMRREWGKLMHAEKMDVPKILYDVASVREIEKRRNDDIARNAGGDSSFHWRANADPYVRLAILYADEDKPLDDYMVVPRSTIWTPDPPPPDAPILRVNGFSGATKAIALYLQSAGVVSGDGKWKQQQQQQQQQPLQPVDSVMLVRMLLFATVKWWDSKFVQAGGQIPPPALAHVGMHIETRVAMAILTMRIIFQNKDVKMSNLPDKFLVDNIEQILLWMIRSWMPKFLGGWKQRLAIGRAMQGGASAGSRESLTKLLEVPEWWTMTWMHVKLLELRPYSDTKAMHWLNLWRCCWGENRVQAGQYSIAGLGEWLWGNRATMLAGGVKNRAENVRVFRGFALGWAMFIASQGAPHAWFSSGGGGGGGAVHLREVIEFILEEYDVAELPVAIVLLIVEFMRTFGIAALPVGIDERFSASDFIHKTGIIASAGSSNEAIEPLNPALRARLVAVAKLTPYVYHGAVNLYADEDEDEAANARDALAGNASDLGSPRTRCVAILQKYAPECVGSVHALLEKHAGDEARLVDALVRKYGPEFDGDEDEQLATAHAADAFRLKSAIADGVATSFAVQRAVVAVARAVEGGMDAGLADAARFCFRAPQCIAPAVLELTWFVPRDAAAAADRAYEHQLARERLFQDAMAAVRAAMAEMEEVVWPELAARQAWLQRINVEFEQQKNDLWADAKKSLLELITEHSRDFESTITIYYRDVTTTHNTKMRAHFGGELDALAAREAQRRTVEFRFSVGTGNGDDGFFGKILVPYCLGALRILRDRRYDFLENVLEPCRELIEAYNERVRVRFLSKFASLFDTESRQRQRIDANTRMPMQNMQQLERNARRSVQTLMLKFTESARDADGFEFLVCPKDDGEVLSSFARLPRRCFLRMLLEKKAYTVHGERPSSEGGAWTVSYSCRKDPTNSRVPSVREVLEIPAETWTTAVVPVGRTMIDHLFEAGVWVSTPMEDGTPYAYHAYTQKSTWNPRRNWCLHPDLWTDDVTASMVFDPTSTFDPQLFPVQGTAVAAAGDGDGDGDAAASNAPTPSKAALSAMASRTFTASSGAASGVFGLNNVLIDCHGNSFLVEAASPQVNSAAVDSAGNGEFITPAPDTEMHWVALWLLRNRPKKWRTVRAQHDKMFVAFKFVPTGAEYDDICEAIGVPDAVERDVENNFDETPLQALVRLGWWVEAQTEDGVPYAYHYETARSVWALEDEWDVPAPRAE